MSGCNVVLESPLRMIGCIVGKFVAMRKISVLNLFKRIIAVQMDWEVGVLFPWRVVNLMCTKCVIVRRVCIKESSRFKTGGEMYLKVKYLSSESALGMAGARFIA